MDIDHAYKHRSEYNIYFIWVNFLHIEFIDAYILYVTKYIHMKQELHICSI